MLPDYPQAKEKLSEYALRRLGAIRRKVTLDIAEETIVEGNSASYSRDDGTGEVLKFQPIHPKISIDDLEFPTLSWADVMKRVEDAARQMGNEMFTSMLEKVNEITKQTGNRAQVNGKLTPEQFINFIKDKIEIQFDANGNAVLPTIVGDVQTSKIIENILMQIHSDKKLQKSFSEAMIIQKERWRDKESHRKLVD